MVTEKKEKKPTKNKKIDIRLTETEYQIITGQAKAVNMKTADYLRSLATDETRIIKKVNTETYRSLVNIASNMNQIAKRLNMGCATDHSVFLFLSQIETHLNAFKSSLETKK